MNKLDIKRLLDFAEVPSEAGQVCYAVRMGSYAYGVNNKDSDMDIYAFSLPPREILFPEKYADVIHGFDTDYKKFDQFQKHHLVVKGVNTDLTVYNIVRYCYLCLNNNPNMIDSLFVDDEDILYINEIGQYLRDHRQYFLSKLCYHRYRGFSFAQFEKMKNKAPSSSRKHLVEKYGVDTKFLYHTYRLIDQVKQILKTHDLKLKDETRIQVMKVIRDGCYQGLGDLEEWFKNEQNELEKLYHESDLRYSPDKDKIKEVLKECIG